MPISKGTYKQFINSIISLAKSKKSSYVCVANVHMLVEAYKSKTFANYIYSADIITPDGMPLSKALNTLYDCEQDRVAGMDLLPDLLSIAEENQLSVFFYGSSQWMLDQTDEYLKIAFPDLIVSGLYSPPFKELTREEEMEVIHKINETNPSIVFVVLGCPKQEKWMYNMKNKINSVMVGIGGALPVLIGVKKRAPVWMQRHSLEWLFRLYQEPHRLFKRYLISNSLFLGLYFKELISKFFRKNFSVKLNNRF